MDDGKNNECDAAIIGGGPGGYVLALECGRRGMKTVLIDRGLRLGGTCLNVGCIPSKALLESSELYWRIMQEAKDHGINIAPDSVQLDLKALMQRKTAVIEKLAGGISALMKARKVEFLTGEGLVTAAGELRLDAHDGTLIRAGKVVLATGSHPVELPMLPFDGKRVIHSTDALSLTTVPKSLAVVGAGAVGLELGSVWNRLGARVTVIEAMTQIVPGADAQAARILAGALKNQGMDIRTGTTVSAAEVGKQNVKLILEKADSSEETLTVDRVLVAVGRRANLDSGLDGVVPERTADGRYFRVNDKYETSVKDLFAIGDVAGGPMLAHKAEEDAIALAALFAGEAHPPWSGPIPGIVYTEPELAWAGETEESLKAADTPFEKGHFPFAANARALAAGTSEGFAKLLNSPEDGRLLGVTIVGKGASELVAEAVSVMAMGGSAEDIALTVHGHPTLSETVKEAAFALLGRPLHRV